MCRASDVREVVHKLIDERGSNSAAAAHLGIAPAHLHNAFTRLSPPPTLEAALVAHGYLPPLPTRIRLAIDCSRETRQAFRDAAAARGMAGEAYLLYLMEVAR